MFPGSSASSRKVSSEAENYRRLAKSLVKRLCGSVGELTLDEKQWEHFYIQVIGSGRSGDMDAFFHHFPHIFSYGPDSTNSEKRIVQVKKTLEICKAHGGRGGCKELVCEGLHCCKFFLHGRCKNELNCKFGHNLSDDHNKKLLARHFLDELTPSEIGVLMKSVQSFPKVCMFYNRQKGCDHGDGGEGCSAMHVCEHYLLGDCKFKVNCKRSHDIFAPQPINILKKSGINVNRSRKEVLKELRAAMRKGEIDDIDEHSDGDTRSSDSDESLGAVGPAPPRSEKPSTYETELQSSCEPDNSKGFETRRSSSPVTAFSRLKFDTAYQKREPRE